MNYEDKQRWIKALCSGAYTQGVGQLRQEDKPTGRVRHCCLGVLCEIKGYGHVSESGALYLPSDNTGAPTIDEAEELGLTEAIVNELVSMNDDKGHSFTFIAGWIEAAVPVEYGI